MKKELKWTKPEAKSLEKAHAGDVICIDGYTRDTCSSVA